MFIYLACLFHFQISPKSDLWCADLSELLPFNNVEKLAVFSLSATDFQMTFSWYYQKIYMGMCFYVYVLEEHIASPLQLFVIQESLGLPKSIYFNVESISRHYYNFDRCLLTIPLIPECKQFGFVKSMISAPRIISQTFPTLIFEGSHRPSFDLLWYTRFNPWLRRGLII